MSLLLEPEGRDCPHEWVPVSVSEKVLNKNQTLPISEASHARISEDFLCPRQEVRGPDLGPTGWIKGVECLKGRTIP